MHHLSFYVSFAPGDEGGRGCEIHTCEAELRAISPAAKLSFPRNSCAEPFLPAKRLRQIFLSRRETGWRTLIWVLSGVRRKIGHLFAYSVGGRFFLPKILCITYLWVWVTICLLCWRRSNLFRLHALPVTLTDMLRPVSNCFFLNCARQL